MSGNYFFSLDAVYLGDGSGRGLQSKKSGVQLSKCVENDWSPWKTISLGDVSGEESGRW